MFTEWGNKWINGWLNEWKSQELKFAISCFTKCFVDLLNVQFVLAFLKSVSHSLILGDCEKCDAWPDICWKLWPFPFWRFITWIKMLKVLISPAIKNKNKNCSTLCYPVFLQLFDYRIHFHTTHEYSLELVYFRMHFGEYCLILIH